MTPEELKEFREWCRTFEVSADSMIMKALEHIDQQAKQIAALREIAIEERIPWLQAREYEPPVTLTWIEQEARRQLAEEHPEAFR